MQKKELKAGAIRLSAVTAFLLAVAKVSVGIFAGSLSLIASAVDSLLDVCASLVNYISLREAEKPADAEHLYGHGKIESLAGLFQSLFIAASGIYLVIEALRRLVHGVRLHHVPAAIVVMLVSMAATFFLVRMLKRIGKKTGSIIVGTEALHYTTDLLSNGGVIAALALVRVTGFAIWDLLVALAIACYVLFQSSRILKASVDELVDRALPKEEQKEIERLILTFDPRIIGFHNLRTRRIGSQRFIDFHMEIRDEKSFSSAHELTEALIKRIRRQFPRADVTVHFDPEGAD